MIYSMSQAMKCPVCPFENIPDDAERCPNCGTDLSALHHINELGARHFNRALELAHANNNDAALPWTSSAVCLNREYIPARTLLGKIFWKKRHHKDALQQWEEAVKIDPENQDALTLLETARRAIRSARNRKKALGIIGVICMALVLILIFYTVRSLSSHIFSIRKELATYQAETDTLRGQLAQYKKNHTHSNSQVEVMQMKMTSLENQMAEYKVSHPLSGRETAVMKSRLAAFEEIEESKKRERERISALLKELDEIDGVILHQKGNVGTLIFSEGLFPSGPDQIDNKAKTILKKILVLLKRQKSNLNVLIEGHTDDIPITKGITRCPDNWTLGLRRANAVLLYMKKNIDSGSVRLTACSAGELNPPFPNDTKTNQRRNRTVLLYLTIDADIAPGYDH